MKFIKVNNAVKVKNLDMKTEQKIKKHGELFPDSIRGLIIGSSNCGKTNVMLNMLLDLNGLKFENIYIFSKSLHQPKYEYLRQIVKTIKGMSYNEFSNNSDIIELTNALPNSIFIFDDVACDKQDNIRNYFCMGRHQKIDSFYLCQSYTRIPKHLVRDNANFLIVFKQDDLNLRHIYSDHVNSDMTYINFKEICNECWNVDYGFLLINKDCALNDGRYRRKFNEFIKL
jgi:hypothetical protein